MKITGSRAPGSAAFIFVFITVALDMMAVGIIVPVLPKLVIQFQHGDVASAAWYVGLFGALWAAMQFIFSPIIGSASDHFGRRPVILASNFGLGFDYILMAVAPTLSWLFIGRLISGITSSSYPTAGAYIADVTPPAERAAKFGMLGAAFGLGFIIGPALGGILGGIDLRLPFWVAAALSLANALYGYFILPESLPARTTPCLQPAHGQCRHSLRLLRSHPELLGLAAAVFLMGLAHEALPNTFVLYADQRYGWSRNPRRTRAGPGRRGLADCLHAGGQACGSGYWANAVRRSPDWPAASWGSWYLAWRPRVDCSCPGWRSCPSGASPIHRSSP